MTYVVYVPSCKECAQLLHILITHPEYIKFPYDTFPPAFPAQHWERHIGVQEAKVYERLKSGFLVGGDLKQLNIADSLCDVFGDHLFTVQMSFFPLQVHIKTFSFHLTSFIYSQFTFSVICLLI